MIPFVAYMLKGDANSWSKAKERILIAPITWEKFKESFYRDFIPSSVRGDEETKIQKFTFRLNLDVQHEVMTFGLKTYFEVVNKAKLVEQALKLTKTEEGSSSGVKRQRWSEV
ncbi:hypothetical protein SLE2022_053000 [Rubroshorea leprosula]